MCSRVNFFFVKEKEGTKAKKKGGCHSTDVLVPYSKRGKLSYTNNIQKGCGLYVKE